MPMGMVPVALSSRVCSAATTAPTAVPMATTAPSVEAWVTL